MNRSPIRYTFCDAPFHYLVQCEHSLNIACVDRALLSRMSSNVDLSLTVELFPYKYSVNYVWYALDSITPKAFVQSKVKTPGKGGTR